MSSRLSLKLLENYVKNVFLMKTQKNPLLNPLFFTHYITLNCNFSCSYCGFAQNGDTKRKYPGQLGTKDTLKLLDIIKKESSDIYFTGGEPTIRPDIVDILKYCKEIGFNTSVNTNMSLIHRKIEVLDYTDNLVASLDMLDEKRYSKTLGVSENIVKQVKQNILDSSKIQKEKKFKMTVNCVVTRDTINDARKVMDFCFDNNINFAIVPAELDDGGINYNLKNNLDYQKLIKEIISVKESGKPVFGTKRFLDTILDFKRFDCYPETIPHIYPNGDLMYPCQPLLKIGANLLEEGSYKKALKEGIRKHGLPPRCKDKCHKACYIEPPIFIKNPTLVLKEFV